MSARSRIGALVRRAEHLDRRVRERRALGLPITHDAAEREALRWAVAQLARLHPEEASARARAQPRDGRTVTVTVRVEARPWDDEEVGECQTAR